jgi:CRISPR-associated endoribonuclease Cas6
LIERYEIALEVEDEKDPLWKSPARGALMHGLLMSQLNAENLHKDGSMQRPYSQYLRPLEYGKYQWIINILDRSQAWPILEWIEKLPGELYLEHYGTPLSLIDVGCTESINYSDFMHRLLEPLPSKFVALDLITPLAFKSAARRNYTLWPEPRLIAQSALSRWNTFGNTAKFDDPSILDDVAMMVQSSSFSLETRHVAMDGINLSGTVGRVSFYIQNAAPVRQVFNLACAYAEYCGLGVKTAMGLGAVLCRPGQVLSKNGVHSRHGIIRQDIYSKWIKR